MIREAVAPQAQPATVGPYCQATKTAGLVFVSGQLGLDPATGKLQSGLEEQTRQAIANVGEVLAAPPAHSTVQVAAIRWIGGDRGYCSDSKLAQGSACTMKCKGFEEIMVEGERWFGQDRCCDQGNCL